MAEFTEAEKTEIVQRLAQFEGPASIVADFKKRGMSTDYRQIGSYDPTRTYFEGAQRWADLFQIHRKRYLEELEPIPAANKAFRVNLLNEAALKARAQGNYALMAQLLRQAAEDCGGALTNRREFGVTEAPEPQSPDERRARLAALLDRMDPPQSLTNAPSVVTAQ